MVRRWVVGVGLVACGAAEGSGSPGEGEPAYSTGIVYAHGDSLWHLATASSAPRRMATVEGFALHEASDVVGSRLLAWSGPGVVSLDLRTGAVERVHDARLYRTASADVCFLFGGQHLYSLETGSFRAMDHDIARGSEDFVVVEPGCARAVVIDRKTGAMRLHSLNDGRQLGVHQLSLKRRFGQYHSLFPRWVDAGLYVDVADTHVSLGSIKVDPSTGRWQTVSRLPDEPGRPSGPVPPTRPGVELQVAWADGRQEVFATVDGVETRITRLADVLPAPEPGEDCEALPPDQQQVRTTLLPGVAGVYVHVTDRVCRDFYTGGRERRATGLVASLDGQTQHVIPLSWWPMDFSAANWTFSPDGNGFQIGDRLFDAELRSVALPPDARVVSWSSTP